MLKLTRAPGETITLFLPDGRTIEIVLDQSRGKQARLGIAAPRDIKILRTELIEQQ